MPNGPPCGRTKRRRRVLARPEGRWCAYCPQPATTVDHVEPLGTGGLDREANLVPCCAACNQRKGSRSLVVFLARRARARAWDAAYKRAHLKRSDHA